MRQTRRLTLSIALAALLGGQWTPAHAEPPEPLGSLGPLDPGVPVEAVEGAPAPAPAAPPAELYVPPVPRDPAPVLLPAPLPDGPTRYQPRLPLVVAGSITFGVGYLLSVAVASLSHNGWFAVPLAGPFLVGGSLIHEAAAPCPTDSYDCASPLAGFVGALAIVPGLMQVTGAALLTAGLVGKRAPAPRPTLAPYLAPGGGGLSLGGRF